MLTITELEVMCTGQYTLERHGYYAGQAEIENFQVWVGSTEITHSIPTEVLRELKSQYLKMCEEECA